MSDPVKQFGGKSASGIGLLGGGLGFVGGLLLCGAAIAAQAAMLHAITNKKSS